MDHAEERERVIAEATTWLRTPYHHRGGIKGAGADCLMLLVRVFHAAVPERVPDIEPGDYAMQWNLHRSAELYLAGLEMYAHELPEGQDPLRGDIALWRFGRTYSHGAIVLDERQVIHAFKDAREVTYGDRWAEPLVSRPVRYFSVFGA